MFSNYPTDDDGLDYFTFVTLIDITKTDVVRHHNKEMPRAEYDIKRNQHRNYQTMLQILGLRVQAVYITDPIKYESQSLTDLTFGSTFKKESVWSFSFGIEQEDIFMTANSPFGLLLDDIHNVPIVLGLEETAKIQPPMLDAFSDSIRNTIILK